MYLLAGNVGSSAVEAMSSTEEQNGFNATIHENNDLIGSTNHQVHIPETTSLSTVHSSFQVSYTIANPSFDKNRHVLYMENSVVPKLCSTLPKMNNKF